MRPERKKPRGREKAPRGRQKNRTEGKKCARREKTSPEPEYHGLGTGMLLVEGGREGFHLTNSSARGARIAAETKANA